MALSSLHYPHVADKRQVEEEAVRSLEPDTQEKMAVLGLGGWVFSYGVLSQFWWAMHERTPGRTISPTMDSLAAAVAWAHEQENAQP